MVKLRELSNQKKFTNDEIMINKWKISKRLELGLINSFDECNSSLSEEDKVKYFKAEQEAHKYIDNLMEVPEDIKKILIEIQNKMLKK